MSNVADTLDLVNEALALIGEVVINSFEDGTDVAATAARIASTRIRGLIGLHPWRFSLRKVQLVPLVQPPVNEWRKAFALPQDMLNMREAFAAGTVDAPRLDRWEIFGQRLLANADAVWVDYQREVPVAEWPPVFRMLVRTTLAADLAIPVAGSPSARAEMLREAFGGPMELNQGGLLAQARRVDSQQQPPQRINDFPLLDARFGARRM